jgi:hypothetical protein
MTRRPAGRTGHRRARLGDELYQEAGVPFLVLGDPVTDPYSAICLELDGTEYRETARAQAGRLTLDRPFPVTVELAGPGH